VVSTAHVHIARTTIDEQIGILSERLIQLRRATFRQLASDCAGTYEIVARFLAVLELYRTDRVSFDQLAPMGDLYVSWTGGDQHDDAARADESGEQDHA
jgi:segregation and condensation protein A